jgi:phenylacetate-CoA ligase
MINPFLNPVFTFKSVKSYLFDIDRIWQISPQGLKRFQDKAFRRAVKFAYTVPLYNKKYKELNIHPNDIKGIEDIRKLPTVSKIDIRNAFPDDIIPKNANMDHLWNISTSGATGKPFSFYRDTFSLCRDLIYSIRLHRFVGIDWRKHKSIGMGPYNSPGRYDYVIEKAILNNLKPFFPSVANFQSVPYIYKDLDEKFEKINEFRPDYIIGTPGDLQAMATLKKNGYGKNIQPKALSTSGGVLDDYIRSYVEDAFQCKIMDVYSSVEMATSAVQCKEGNYHVFSDYIFFEFLDEKGEPVASGEPGHIVITRLFDRGTPFIRYTGVDDIVTPLYEKCPCGLHSTQLIKRIEGRRSQRIYSPDGKYITPVFFTRGVDAAMKSLKTDKIIQYQVVQKSIDSIEILCVVNENQKDSPPSLEILFSEIKKEYYKVFGDAFHFEIKEVKKVIGNDNSAKPPALIISKLNKQPDRVSIE